MELNKTYNEPCLETLKKMPDEFLDCVITSPPYWQLIDYGYDGQWGLEPTFYECLENLWLMMIEIKRVLKTSGTVWINLGDTYNGNKISNNDPKQKESNIKSKVLKKKQNAPNKSLLLIPHRFALGCMDMGWVIRNDIVWAKRNGMPESVTDRFSKKHEYFFFMTKSTEYFFDLDAIRDKINNPVIIRNKSSEIYGRGSGSKQFSEGERVLGDDKKGKNPGSVSDFWDIPTKPSKNEHYASYSDTLLKKPILAGCTVNGIVYDPFMGTGSTAEVCIRSNRFFIGSEMSLDYIKIHDERINPFLNQGKLF